MSPHRRVVLLASAFLAFWVGVYAVAVVRLWDDVGTFALLLAGYLVTSAIVTTLIWLILAAVIYKIIRNLIARRRS